MVGLAEQLGCVGFLPQMACAWCCALLWLACEFDLQEAALPGQVDAVLPDGLLLLLAAGVLLGLLVQFAHYPAGFGVEDLLDFVDGYPRRGCYE